MSRSEDKKNISDPAPPATAKTSGATKKGSREQVLAFGLPTLPKSINRVGMHWSWKVREKTRWLKELAVIKAASPEFDFHAKRKRRVRIQIWWAKRGPLPDSDNIIAGLKPMVDAMKSMGFIFDDSPAWVEVFYDIQKSDYNQTDVTIFNLS